MIQEQTGSRRIAVGGDKAYDMKGFVASGRSLGATPKVAQDKARRRGSVIIDERTTRHAGSMTSQAKRKWVEEVFA
jgi:hypothetical protein